MKKMILLVLLSFSLIGHENFILIGPPGSGKGTFSSYMIEHHNFHHICPGDIVRTIVKTDTELGREIKPIVERGDYINDDIIFKIIEQQICQCVEQNIPFIVDGFPRSIASFEFLMQLLEKKSIISKTTFIHFVIDDQTCIDRISNRLVCFNCFSIFNMISKKPLHEMTCDCCGAHLEIRIGDTVATTTKRLAYYRKNIEPLIEEAKKYFTICTVNANSDLSNLLDSYKSYTSLE